MKIIINGKEKEFSPSGNLKHVVEQFCELSSTSQRVIAEVNGTIIKSAQWSDTAIQNGDKIELVGFVGGG